MELSFVLIPVNHHLYLFVDEESGMVSGESGDACRQGDSSGQISESGRGEVRKGERPTHGLKKKTKVMTILGEGKEGRMTLSQVDA